MMRIASGFFEQVLCCAAVRADPIFGKVFEFDSWLDILGVISYCRIIHIATNGANPLLHDRSSLG